MYPELETLGEGGRAPKHLLLVRLDNIGDIVMLGPALRAISESFPEARLTLMASPAGTQAASLLPWIDETFTWRAVWQDVSGQIPQDPERELGLVQELQKKELDAAFIFTSFTQSPYPPAYICYLAGIPVRIGQSKEFGGSLLTHWKKPPSDDGHQVDRNLALLDIIGLPIKDRRLELQIPQKDVRSASNILRAVGIEPGSAYLIAAPGASCSARRYNTPRFARVVELLTQKNDLPILIIGGKREAKTLEPFEELARDNEKIVSLVGKTSIPELAALIRGAALVIANNSASLHIADAFQRPLIVLYSGTEHESQWKPRSSTHRLLRRATECSPCFSFDCPYSMECLDIPPEEVVESALALLNQFSKAPEGKFIDNRLYSP
jgi:ADP-heptose:LPS heptosyltransferase